MHIIQETRAIHKSVHQVIFRLLGHGLDHPLEIGVQSTLGFGGGGANPGKETKSLGCVMYF